MTDNIFTPYLPQEEWLHAAWYGCLHWALGEKKVVESFRLATGNAWKPSNSSIEQAIDKATGADKEFFESFANWMNENIWGK
jgi:hypothetical protein